MSSQTGTASANVPPPPANTSSSGLAASGGAPLTHPDNLVCVGDPASPHVFHARKDPERYWGAVQSLWSEAVKLSKENN